MMFVDRTGNQNLLARITSCESIRVTGVEHSFGYRGGQMLTRDANFICLPEFTDLVHTPLKKLSIQLPNLDILFQKILNNSETSFLIPGQERSEIALIERVV